MRNYFPETEDLVPEAFENLSNYAVFIVDNGGGIMSWNKGSEKIIHYTKNDIIGSPLSILYSDEDNETSLPGKNLDQARMKGCFESQGWRLRKDESRFWASETISVMSGSNGSSGFMVIMQDLTAQKEAETASREWMRVFEDSGWAIARVEHGTTEFELVNKPFAGMYGYTVEELCGMKVLDLVLPALREEFLRKIQELKSTGYILFESTHVHRNGHQLHVMIEGNTIKDHHDNIRHLLINVRNLSEFGEVQQRYLQSEEKYRQLFEQASDGIFIADLNGTYTNVNPVALKMLGYEKHELVGKTILDLVPQEEEQQLKKSRQNLSEPGCVDVREWHLRKKDGTYLPVEVSAKILPDGRWQAFVRDISERVKLQQALKRSERKFRTVMEEAHDGIVIVNSSGQIEFSNKIIAQWFGYTQDELNARSIETLIPERFRAMHVAHRFRYMADPVARPMNRRGIDLLGLKKDGAEFPIEVSLSPIESEEGISVAAFIRDLSDRKRSDAQYKFLAESSRILIEEFDIVNSLRKMVNRITPFMADFCIIFYYEQKELKVKATSHHNKEKQGLLDEVAQGLFTDPNSCPYPPGTSISSHQAVLLSHISDSFLKNLSCDAGHLAGLRELDPRSIILSPLVAHNKVAGLLFLAMNGSGRRYNEDDVSFTEILSLRIQIALRNIMLYEAAQKATQARQDILAIVSHDLKNPLTVVKGACQIIPGLIEKRDPDSVASLMEAAGKSIILIERLISDLLDFSKLQEGSFQISPRPASVNGIVMESIAPFSNQLSEKNIQFRYDEPPKELIIDCDPLRVTQILMNILGNAVKFTPPKGKVELQVKPFENAVLFSISDTGPGISAEQLPHIFERYWQVKHTAHLGTGLGLSIVKGLVEAHHGRIWVESTVGEGSTFNIEIPKKFMDTEQTEDSSL